MRLRIKKICKNCEHYVYFLGFTYDYKDKIWVHSPDLSLWCKHCDCKNPEPGLI